MASRKIKRAAKALFQLAQSEAQASEFWTPRMVLNRNLELADVEGFNNDREQLDEPDFTDDDMRDAYDIALDMAGVDANPKRGPTKFEGTYENPQPNGVGQNDLVGRLRF